MATSGETQSLNSAFDQHHPPSPELMDKCVHCGFCLQTCPTYALWGEEMDSPRGRIYLMKLASEGRAELNDKFVQHIDACLGCMACMTACPSGVDYSKLIEATRQQIERNYQRGRSDDWRRKFIFSVFPNPARLAILTVPAWLYQRSGLQKFAKWTGLLRLLPKNVREMEALLPTIKLPRRLPTLMPAKGDRRARVGLMLGCVQRVFFPHVNAATARVLSAEGCEVVIPRDQSCCGALMVHAGMEERAQALARMMIDSFDFESLDAIVINAAGCGSNMKEYGHLLRDDPNYAERARMFAAKCRDVSELLDQMGPRAIRKPIRTRIAYHDSCHLQHAQGICVQPRNLLKSIPELELVELAESAICCGSAGIYNLVQPEAAEQLGDRKAAHISAVSPEAVVSGNPGCLLQIKASLARAHVNIPVMHVVEVLDRALTGQER